MKERSAKILASLAVGMFLGTASALMLWAVWGVFEMVYEEWSAVFRW